MFVKYVCISERVIIASGNGLPKPVLIYYQHNHWEQNLVKSRPNNRCAIMVKFNQNIEHFLSRKYIFHAFSWKKTFVFWLKYLWICCLQKQAISSRPPCVHVSDMTLIWIPLSCCHTRNPCLSHVKWIHTFCRFWWRAEKVDPFEDGRPASWGLFDWHRFVWD